MKKVQRKNFYAKDFEKRFGILDTCIRNIALFFLIPVPTLNKMYLEGGYNKVYKFIYRVELYRRFGLLPEDHIRMRKYIEYHSGNTKYFPKDLIKNN